MPCSCALRLSDLPVANELLRQLGYDIEGAELASRIERAPWLNMEKRGLRIGACL